MVAAPSALDGTQDAQQHLLRRAADDLTFAEWLRTDPRQAIRIELGIELPADVRIRVHENDEKLLHLVIPPKPQLLECPHPARDVGQHALTGSFECWAETAWSAMIGCPKC